MPDWSNYRRGVHQLSDRAYVYLQPNGSWGLNNTLLFAGEGENLLVDTSTDLPLTQAMLNAYAAATPRASQIDNVLLTHWHVDHVHGVCAPALAQARVFASKICAEFMAGLPFEQWVAGIDALDGDAKRMIREHFGAKFDFRGLSYRAPTHLFEGMVSMSFGGARVEVIETKPSHTRSDSIVFFPDEGVVHTGDIIAPRRHVAIQYPFMTHLIEACEQLIAWSAKTYVPGHAALMSLKDVEDIRDYLMFVRDHARASFDQGLSPEDANARLLGELGPYERNTGAHNLYFSIRMMYCEFAGDKESHVRQDYSAYLAGQWRLKQQLMASHPHLYSPV